MYRSSVWAPHSLGPKDEVLKRAARFVTRNCNYETGSMTGKCESPKKSRKGNRLISQTQIPPSKPKWEIIKITNSQNGMRTYGQPRGQLFPKRWPISNPNRTKNMIKHKMKRHRNSDNKMATENDNRTTCTTLERSVIDYYT